MITNDKVIEIFSAADDFFKKFDEEIEKHASSRLRWEGSSQASNTMSDTRVSWQLYHEPHCSNRSLLLLRQQPCVYTGIYD